MSSSSISLYRGRHFTQQRDRKSMNRKASPAQLFPCACFSNCLLIFLALFSPFCESMSCSLLLLLHVNCFIVLRNCPGNTEKNGSWVMVKGSAGYMVFGAKRDLSSFFFNPSRSLSRSANLQSLDHQCFIALCLSSISWFFRCGKPNNILLLLILWYSVPVLLFLAVLCCSLFCFVSGFFDRALPRMNLYLPCSSFLAFIDMISHCMAIIDAALRPCSISFLSFMLLPFCRSLTCLDFRDWFEFREEFEALAMLFLSAPLSPISKSNQEQRQKSYPQLLRSLRLCLLFDCARISLLSA